MTLSPSPDADVHAGDGALKVEMRAEALARRDTMTAEERVALSGRAASKALTIDLSPGAAIGGFMPIRSEIDPRPLLDALAARGHTLALPAILSDRITMAMRRWAPGEALVQASFGLSVPDETAPEIVPDVLIVPLAAFDRRGYRIGYGAGHYDRYLARVGAAKRIQTIGLAFAAQEVPRVPHEPHDHPLDWIATDAGIIRSVRTG